MHFSGGVCLWTAPDRRVSYYVVVYYKEEEESRREKNTTEAYLDFTKIPHGAYSVQVHAE